jgi:site-specific recombinase XerD
LPTARRRLLKSGAPANDFTKQTMLGHERLETTEVYSHISNERLSSPLVARGG